jgi:hypothetical protein
LSPRKRPSPQPARPAGELRGPRGGLTTVTPGGLTRVSTYLDEKERSAVRARAFQEERSISDVIRSAVRHYLGLEQTGRRQ